MNVLYVELWNYILNMKLKPPVGGDKSLSLPLYAYLRSLATGYIILYPLPLKFFLS